MGILERFSLEGKVALVTGGAGKYGRQVVCAVAGAGARVFVASRSIAPLETLAAELNAAGGQVEALSFDQGDEASVRALRDTILGRAGRCDVLVNNAVLRPMLGGWDSPAAQFAESMRVNATGLFIISRAFGNAMAERGAGAMVNIGSIQGRVGPDPAIYTGTDMHGWVPDYFFHKGGMENFTRFLASYYGRFGVRCNCLAPGGFQTPEHPEAFVRQYSERTCLGRMANDTDLMGAVVFMASDAAKYITGAVLPVDGGYTAK
mgnify:CR=1 FL=1